MLAPDTVPGPYLDSCGVFGEFEEPLRWSVEDPPVNGHRTVRTPGDDTLHHASPTAFFFFFYAPDLTEPDRTGANRSLEQTVIAVRVHKTIVAV